MKINTNLDLHYYQPLVNKKMIKKIEYDLNHMI